MGFFRANRNRRGASALLLVVWLLASVSGIANACLSAEDHSAIVHIASIATSHQAHMLSPANGAADVIEDDDNSSHDLKALCLDACDDRSHSLRKQNLSIDQPYPGPMTLAAIPWVEFPHAASTNRVERESHADFQALPIRLRYSRLTL
jgi:hypothetical protein